MTESHEPIAIGRIIAPRSIAVIGATEDVSKFGGRICDNLVRHRFPGTIAFVNPRRDRIFGLPAYPDIASAPKPIDVALLAVPAAGLLDAVAACGDAGVGACIVITAQLAEFDEAGAALQRRIAATARERGTRLIGPNCLGMISPAYALALSSSPTLQYATALRRGSVSFVSQSGALMGTLFVFAHDHGIGLSAMVTVGNQADLTLLDFYDGLVDDPHTRTICLYVEDIGDGARFRAVALRARAAGKRTLVAKAGRSAAGVAMARSHTASLAGSFAAFEATCRDSGVLIADEAEGMILVAGIMATNPKLGVGGIGLVVSSGGNGALTIDRLAARKLPVAIWSAETRARLSAHFLPTHQNNPIDLGAHKGALGPHIFTETLEAAFEDPGVAALVYIMTPQPLMPQTMQCLIDLWRRREKPVVVVLDTARFGDGVRDMALEAGMPYLSRIDDLIRALEFLVSERETDVVEAAVARPAGMAALPREVAPGPLDEPGAKSLFVAAGIPVPRERIVHSAEAAAEAAVELGLPVVLKGIVPGVVHNSDAGLVRLGVADADGARRAFAEIAATTGASAPAVSVQEMVRGHAEIIVGARRDETFGPQLLIGFGGTFVEIVADVVTAAAPLSPEQALRLLRRLTLWPLLDGARGRPKLDVAALADLIARFSTLACDLGDRLEDLEINPVIVRETGAGVCAVDGRGTLR